MAESGNAVYVTAEDGDAGWAIVLEVDADAGQARVLWLRDEQTTTVGLDRLAAGFEREAAAFLGYVDALRDSLGDLADRMLEAWRAMERAVEAGRVLCGFDLYVDGELEPQERVDLERDLEELTRGVRSVYRSTARRRPLTCPSQLANFRSIRVLAAWLCADGSDPARRPAAARDHAEARGDTSLHAGNEQ